MSFLANDAVNRVNLQSGLQALARGAGAVFLLVFLIKAGVTIPDAFLAQAAIVAGRFVIRPILLPIAIRVGLKPVLLAGTVGLAAQYPLLAEVHGVGPMLVAMCAASAIGEVFYYVASNTYFAALGDVEHRGRQVAMNMALAAIAGVIAPLAAGWSLVLAGPRWTFDAVAVVQLLSVIPLLPLPNIRVAATAPGAWAAARLSGLLILADGWFDGVSDYIWRVWLFVTLGQSYLAYGGAMALAGVAGAAAGFIVGGHVDGGRGRRATLIGYSAAASVVILRACSLHTPWLAGLANALGALALPLLVPPLSAATHNMAKASPCPLRVKMTSEAGWDVGCFGACLIAAALAWAHAPPQLSILLALPALAAGGALLWRYYRPVTAARSAQPLR
ncbi:MAG TPA: MFS transporter [Caulobacteraceae bacterium]|jgi:hypothetical protein